MVEFYSAHASLLTEYIDFKRSLGYKYQLEYAFKKFDTFLVKNNFTQIGLTRGICELWSIKQANESFTNRYKRVNNIRNYSIYLNGLGYTSYIPMDSREFESTFTPYIFTKDEVERFFLACDSIDLTSRSETAHIYPALFRVIYGCGLRVSEAITLKCTNVNLDEKYIIIYESKNGEDRILPISESLSEILCLYKNTYFPKRPDQDYFFSKLNGGKCSSDTVYRWFRTILRKAGISHGGKGYGPRVHDFRHTFSVHSLATMSDAGLDLYYCLPLLSKYLGHKSLEATDKYVRLTSDIYPGIMNEMNRICAFVFPEVREYETD